jgi:hypothetical protein
MREEQLTDLTLGGFGVGVVVGRSRMVEATLEGDRAVGPLSLYLPPALGEACTPPPPHQPPAHTAWGWCG